MTDAEIAAAEPRERPYKICIRGGLFVSVNKGCKSFRLKYRDQGREQLLTIGRFPELTLEEALREAEGFKAARREERRQARAIEGVDPKPAKPCYVYFIQSPCGHIKIGISEQPRKRLMGLQSSFPQKLTCLGVMPGGRNIERSLHERYKAERTYGEWFRRSPDLLDFIAKNTQPFEGAWSTRRRTFGDQKVVQMAFSPCL